LLTLDRPDIFDEYARRQYVAKAPNRNPFGDDDDPIRFNDLNVFTRVRVLQQLSTWTFGNAERIRSMMPEDAEPLDWRMEPLGWDKDDRAYFVLDDNRLYRRSDEPPPAPSPPPKAKAKPKATPTKGKSRGTRTSKRRKVEETEDEEMEDVQEQTEDDVKMEEEEEAKVVNGESAEAEDEPGFGFTNKTWQCIAVTLEDYNNFLATIFRSRDPNEKHLRKMIEERIIPLMEERAERLQQQKLAELRKMEIQASMATAKRSGRLAAKQERDKEEQDKRDVEEKRKQELREAHEEQERIKRAEDGHESRRQTREQRVKEREMKRILREEELAKLEEEATRASSQDPTVDATEADGIKRASGRQNKSERERHRQELERIAQEEDNWYFDCVKCHQHGDNFDDGTHSIACEKCNVWQHSECHGIRPEQAEDPSFHFICSRCIQKAEDAKKPKIAPLKLGKSHQSSSPAEKKSSSRPTSSKAPNGTPRADLPEHVARQLDGVRAPQSHPSHEQSSPYAPMTNGPSISPYGQMQGPPGTRYPPVGNFAPRSQQAPPPQQPWQGNAFPPPQRPPSSGYAGSPPPPMTNGHGPLHQHQQHHQIIHRNAVSASGHPPYQHPNPAYPAPPNGYSPRAPPGMYPMAQPQQHQFQHYQSPPNRYAQPVMQQPPQLQRPGSQGQVMNGAQAPPNGSSNPLGMPGQPQPHQHQRQPSYGQLQNQDPQGYGAPPPVAQSPQQPYHQPQNVTSRSPSATFHPQQAYAQPQAHSPVKSSPQQPLPPPPYQQHPQYHQPPTAPGARTPTAPQSLRPLSSNGYGPSPHQQNQQTPVVAPRASPQTAQAHPSPAGSNANAVAADGMSGPWPEASSAIPQKHDRSPAAPPLPPASLHAMPGGVMSSPAAHHSVSTHPVDTPAGLEAKAMVPPVALSPTQQQVHAQLTGPGSVPVKKSPVVDGEGSFAPSVAQQISKTGEQAATNGRNEQQ